MDIFLKATGAVLIAAIFVLVLNKTGRDISILITIAVCVMVVASALTYLQPVLSFFRRLVELGELDHELLAVLLKIVGIGMISQVAALICSDAGNQSLGKALQIMTTAVILCVSVPVLEQMLMLIEKILGKL